ncbi:unnamed protein product [Dovyalis caffra]|uniref:Uncharacterized protein n=1 Tax=Dovyalis caffra TaxID=77055 RepID=A0AAV1QPD0_9ROSI|nr:unnamed protein product [Dovyalis caffra]
MAKVRSDLKKVEESINNLTKLINGIKNLVAEKVPDRVNCNVDEGLDGLNGRGYQIPSYKYPNNHVGVMNNNFEGVIGEYSYNYNTHMSKPIVKVYAPLLR